MTTDLDKILDGATDVSWESIFQIWSKSVRVKGGFYPNKYPRVQQMRPHADFRLLNTYRHF